MQIRNLYVNLLVSLDARNIHRYLRQRTPWSHMDLPKCDASKHKLLGDMYTTLVSIVNKVIKLTSEKLTCNSQDQARVFTHVALFAC